MLIEHAFTCPCCWETVTVLLDLSADDQDYVEDCEVCCRPLRIHLRAADGELIDFGVESDL